MILLQYICDKCGISCTFSDGKQALDQGWRRVVVGEPFITKPSNEHKREYDCCCGCVATLLQRGPPNA